MKINFLSFPLYDRKLWWEFIMGEKWCKKRSVKMIIKRKTMSILLKWLLEESFKEREIKIVFGCLAIASGFYSWNFIIIRMQIKIEINLFIVIFSEKVINCRRSTIDPNILWIIVFLSTDSNLFNFYLHWKGWNSDFCHVVSAQSYTQYAA